MINAFKYNLLTKKGWNIDPHKNFMRLYSKAK